jgi:hypothetical protein
LPRLKNRQVLEQAIIKGAGSRDFFGTAYGQHENKLDGFKFGDANVQLDDTLLLIEPEAAKAYEAAITAVIPPPPPPPRVSPLSTATASPSAHGKNNSPPPPKTRTPAKSLSPLTHRNSPAPSSPSNPKALSPSALNGNSSCQPAYPISSAMPSSRNPPPSKSATSRN